MLPASAKRSSVSVIFGALLDASTLVNFPSASNAPLTASRVSSHITLPLNLPVGVTLSAAEALNVGSPIVTGAEMPMKDPARPRRA